MAKFLFVTTSNDRMGSDAHPTGSWIEEVAAPYYVLTDAGIPVTIASIKGGVIPFDPNSLKPDAVASVASQRFLADKTMQAALAASPALSTLNADEYDGIFLPGGHGVMWDLPGNATLGAVLAKYDAAGKIIAAVCHGPAGLLGAIRADAKPLVSGRKLTGFTDAEEATVGLTAVVPFLLETELRASGAAFESAPSFTPHVVQDGHLITGQNPMSSELVGEAILAALKA